jgi:hypothetical protein
MPLTLQQILKPLESLRKSFALSAVILMAIGCWIERLHITIHIINYRIIGLLNYPMKNLRLQKSFLTRC